MITAKRIPIDKNPLDFTAEEILKKDGGRLCVVVPTARNLRILANCLFKTAELFSAKDFTSFANLASGTRIPKQLRTFYLRKAAKEISKKDKLTLFKSENGIFFENFGAFAQASLGIFSFYRELSSEMVKVETLSSAGKYTDYEEQIQALERLWKKYLSLTEKDGWAEEWEDLKNPEFRSSFISRYDDFIFLVGGYLTRYELKQLEEVGKIKNVTLLFNYAGAKYALHSQYEKYLGIELTDRPLKRFSNETCLLVSCPSMAAQAELITKQAFRLNEAGVDFSRMAVLIPDEYVKSYFLRCDPYNLFDVTSGENIDSFPYYKAVKSIAEAAWEITSSGQTEIGKAIGILSCPAVKNMEGSENAISDLEEQIKNGRLFISREETLRIPFFKKFAAAPILWDKFQQTADTAGIIKNIFIKFFRYAQADENIFRDIITRLEELETVYSKITEEIETAENVKLLFAELSSLKIDSPKGKIPVMGILESRNLAFDFLFIPAMNEDIFPPSSKKDLFLNTEIRQELGLPTFIDRENLMKNYLLQIMEKASHSLISYTKNGNSRRRSRFAEELAVKNGLEEMDYSPKTLSIFSGKRRIAGYNGGIIIEKNDEIMENIKKTVFSATSFNDYLVCSLKFYFKRLDKTLPKPKPEKKITDRLIGNAFHKALETLYRKKIRPSSEEYEKEFKKIYRTELSKADAYGRFAERFRAEQAEKGIKFITKAEAERESAGYVTVNREKRIESSFEGFKIKGTIDRIDEKNSLYDIIDYKYKNNIKEPPKNFVMEKQKDLQMPFYALLMETSQNIVPAGLYKFDLKDSFKFVPAFDMGKYGEFKDFFLFKMNELLSENIPFEKTPKISDCDYCEYASICGRVVK